jgi:hypothetical protein
MTKSGHRCAVKGAGPQREINPPGNWIAPPGSNRSGGGGNKGAGASGERPLGLALFGTVAPGLCVDSAQ